jgi:hypothetical protein
MGTVRIELLFVLLAPSHLSISAAFDGLDYFKMCKAFGSIFLCRLNGTQAVSLALTVLQAIMSRAKHDLVQLPETVTEQLVVR